MSDKKFTHIIKVNQQTEKFVYAEMCEYWYIVFSAFWFTSVAIFLIV